MSSTGPSWARGRTVTGQERAEAVQAGALMANYLNCRWAGASHAEVLEALGAGVGLAGYGVGREAGASHAELMEAHKLGAGSAYYARCRWAGATQAEVLEALRAGADMYWYANCRKAGATHAEAIALRLARPPSGPGSGLSAELVLSALRAACGANPTRPRHQEPPAGGS